MQIRRLSSGGCLLIAIVVFFIISLIGRFTIAVLRFLTTTPLGWILIVAVLFYLWRNKPRIQIYRSESDSNGEIRQQVPDDDYVVLDDENDE